MFYKIGSAIHKKPQTIKKKDKPTSNKPAVGQIHRSFVLCNSEFEIVFFVTFSSIFRLSCD